MVLPAPAPHDESAPSEASWLDELTLALRLSRGGILVHISHARLERLGELVRAIAREHPIVDVAADVRAATNVLKGSVLVLLPKATDADWLNLQRPVFKRRELKVVLFCDQETSIALAQDAPDFFDWISLHQDCPLGTTAYAVLGLRAALAADAPVVWNAAGEPVDIERVGSAFSAAFPGKTLHWLTPTSDYGLHRLTSTGDYKELVKKVREAKDAWVACRPRVASHLYGFFWALAEAGRRSRALVVTDMFPCPGHWPVHDRMMPFVEARRTLEEAGAMRAGALAALAELEPEAVELARELLGRGAREEHLVELLVGAEDPGAALAWEAYKDELSLLSKVAERTASPPLLRGFTGGTEMQRMRGSRLGAIALYFLAWIYKLWTWWSWRGSWWSWRRQQEDVLTGKATRVTQRLHHWRNARYRGEIAEAEMGLKHLLSDTSSSLGVEHPFHRSIRHEYALVLAEQWKYDEALRVLGEAIALEGRFAGVAHDDFAALIQTLAVLLTWTGRAIQAETLLRKLLGPDASLPGKDDTPPPATVRGTGMSPEAAGTLTLFLARSGAPPRSPSVRVGALRVLAFVQIVQGRYEEAEASLERAVALLPELPSEDRERWLTRITQSQILALKGQDAEALEILRDVAARAETGRLYHTRILAEIARVEHRLTAPEAASAARRALAAYREAACSEAEAAAAQRELEPIAAGGA